MKAEPNCRPLSLVLLPALLLLSFAQATAAPSNNVTPEASCPSCDDLNFCTVDSCDPTTGTCRHDPLSCDDHNPCTTDSCSPFGVGRGTCDHGELPIGTACSDGDPCTQGDSCRIVGTTSFRCVGTPLAAGSSCDDGNSCTTSDTCSNTGQCVGTPATAGSPCDDQSLCTSNDTCATLQDGSLACRGTVKDCGDGNLCTQDLCDPATGQCGNPAVDCNDGNSCTSDSCDPATGACVRTPLSGTCSDGNPCTTADFCSGGNCLAGPPRNCDDLFFCTRDSCVVDLGGCQHVPDDSLCPPNSPCATWVCNLSNLPGSLGGCSNVLPQGPRECDGNLCTSDFCVRGFCQVFFNNTNPCDDHNVCTVSDRCGGGHCSGTPLCDDANPCTSDSCDPVTAACGHTNNTDPCSDGNPCTAGDACNGGTCQSGTLLNCDDGNACTVDACNGTGCSHTDSSAACDDGDVCTADSCDPATGCVHQPITSQSTCGVGACQRTVDTCVNGVPQPCVPGTPTPEVCNGIDDDCDGLVDESRVQADCIVNPSTLNLNSQGSSFSMTCKLFDVCDPANPAPISGSTVSQVYVSRVDGADSSNDDVTLPDPSTLPCPDPVLGFLYERGISENLAARDVSNANVTFKFNLPSDGNCSTLDGDRQDLAARLTAIPDNTSATLCISGKTGGADFQACVLILVRNKGLR